MPPRTRKPVTTSDPPLPELQYAQVTIVPPRGSAPASKTPSFLKFPLLVILSLSIGTIANTAYYELLGPRLNVISPDGNQQWQVYATLAWKITELAVGWFAGFDARDVAALSVLTHAPHMFLLNTYYDLPFPALVILFLINSAATFVPFFLVRRPAAFHIKTTPDEIAGDLSITSMTTVLATLLYSLPYLALTVSGLLPVFLATYFSGLKTLEAAHASTLPGVAAFLLPLGFAATTFFFVPAAHSLSEAQTTTYVMEFDPVSATLGQTLHRNLLWHLYLPARLQEATKRIILATALTLAYTAFWAFVEVEGVEVLGALGWATVWAAGAFLAGSGLAWVSGLAE